jgi:threonine aldolase
MIFASDNWAGAHPKIAEGLAAHSSGYAPAYGASDLDRAVDDQFSVIFERDVAVFFVATGTAANALSLASVNRPGGITFAHCEAHILEDECGAPEYLTGGARLHAVDGPLGRMAPGNLRKAIAKFDPNFVHGGQPMAVSITQATEAGTIHSLDDIDMIAKVAGEFGLPLHMDGARFANALAALDATPAEMTWKRGVDILSFGGTKNGCWCAEAVVLFGTEKVREFAFLRKRAAQLFSKSRFVAAQFQAYFKDGLWLETASHANAMAARLAERIKASRNIRLGWEPQANELFAVMDEAYAEGLKKKGVMFAAWPTPHGFADKLRDGEKLFRFVTSFATTQTDVDALGDLIC